MKKILAVLLIVGLIAAIPGMVLATKEEKGKPETPPGLSEKTNIKVAFKGVVVEINVLGNINIIKVVLVEPFFKILKKRIDAGETINVNIEKATFFKAPEGKLDTKPSLLNEYVQILGVYEETITPKIVNAKIVRILVQPPGHVIGMGKITILGTNSFALEMKPRKGEKDLVTRIFIVTGKTVIILKGEKVGFPKIEIGMRAVVKGYNLSSTTFSRKYA